MCTIYKHRRCIIVGGANGMLTLKAKKKQFVVPMEEVTVTFKAPKP
jgi:hypothetical protein